MKLSFWKSETEKLGYVLLRLLNLGTIVFAPDVQHKNGCNEQERHYQNRNRATTNGSRRMIETQRNQSILRYMLWINLHFNTRRIVGIETPHTSGASTTCSTASGCSSAAAGSFTLFQVTSTSSATWCGRRQFAGRAGATAHGCRTCWSRLKIFKYCWYIQKLLLNKTRNNYHIIIILLLLKMRTRAKHNRSHYRNVTNVCGRKKRQFSLLAIFVRLPRQ